MDESWSRVIIYIYMFGYCVLPADGPFRPKHEVSESSSYIYIYDELLLTSCFGRNGPSAGKTQ